MFNHFNMIKHKTTSATIAKANCFKNTLRSYGGNNSSDAYGTTVKQYMKKFSGYDTSMVTPDKKARVTP